MQKYFSNRCLIQKKNNDKTDIFMEMKKTHENGWNVGQTPKQTLQVNLIIIVKSS